MRIGIARHRLGQTEILRKVSNYQIILCQPKPLFRLTI